MKTSPFKSIIARIPSFLAIGCIIILATSVQPKKEVKDEPVASAAAIRCCWGYSIPADKLRQFMLDSLKSGAFEGGIYSKRDLLKAINSISGDSVYLMNAWLDCVLNEGNGMFITSPTGQLQIVSKNPYCAPCPGRACCPQRICASRINRTCINYKQPGSIVDNSSAIETEMTLSE